ncbi:MAG TPA: MaoC family dehydratase [Candidatus Paceibacterota bacterium]|nr:MaoC family dehydratase [Candidatus Paceibacterota bacterium]
MRSSWAKEFPCINEEEISRFARLMQDENPLHHDDAIAKKAGLHGIIAPGVMISGYASAAIAEEVPCVKVTRLEMTFKNPLYAGSLPSVFCSVLQRRKSLVRLALSIKNGAEDIAEGTCLLLLPQ